jgi:hypothetical protein
MGWREGKPPRTIMEIVQEGAMAPKASSKRKSVTPLAARATSRAKTKATRTKEARTDPAYVAWPLVPHIPNEKDRKEKLKENLKKMGCSCLMDVPWKWTSEVILQELATRKVPNQFQNTIRGHPEKWTQELIARALNLEVEGDVIPQRASAEEYQKYFSVAPHNSDGWKFSDCNNQDLREVLRFLIPLIRPSKPTRLNVAPVATIAHCLLEGKQISWAGIFMGVMDEVGNLKDAHPECYLPAYAIHLYLMDNVLTDKE